jgi:DNA-binding response OmpR family regulator
MQRLLIVEDDPAIMRGLKDNFLKEGFDVLTARDGDTGLEMALDEAVDLILLDIMLPGLDGYEVCKSVRMEKKDVPIIMLTAKGREEDVIRGLELGADDYVTKPFSIRELIMRVRNFLRLYQSGEQEIYVFGENELNLASHCFMRDGQEVDLTSKEFRMLAYFLQKSGRALTRDQILNAVWGNQILVTSRSVDRCVTTLRSKIEPIPSKPTYIKTIRDVGYRFELPSDS